MKAYLNRLATNDATKELPQSRRVGSAMAERIAAYVAKQPPIRQSGRFSMSEFRRLFPHRPASDIGNALRDSGWTAHRDWATQKGNRALRYWLAPGVSEGVSKS